jgi:hypothetical protein
MKGSVIASLLVAACAANSANVTTNTFGIQSWNMNHINYWIVPGIVAGLAVFIGIILIFLFALC